MNRFAIILLAVLIFATPLVRAVAPVPDDYFASLLHAEGCRLTAYHDNGRQWTVGIGHRVSIKRPAKMNYSMEEVREFYINDMARILAFLRSVEPNFDLMPFAARNAAVHLVWTCGEEGYPKWARFRAAINAWRWDIAARELQQSRWWEQTGWERGPMLRDALLRLDTKG